jgi:hypothetical protein
MVIEAENEAEEAEKEAEEAEKEAEREAEEAKEREKAESKERVKQAARQLALVMQKMWRAECRRCIGDGVGVAHLTSTSVTVTAGVGVGSHSGGETGQPSSSSSSQSWSSVSHRQHPTRPSLGGYSVLGRTLEGWETFVLQGSDTLKRWVGCRNCLSPISALISLISSPILLLISSSSPLSLSCSSFTLLHSPHLPPSPTFLLFLSNALLPLI